MAATDPRPPRRRRRVRGPALFAALVLAAVAASAAASASLSRPAPVPMERQLQEEIDGMVAAGVPADSPKMAMLEDQLDQLRAGADAHPPQDTGADTGALLSKAAAAEKAEADGAAPAGPAWDSGPVECEVVPGLLGPGEIAGATCVSAPQPDGTERYVAIGADGVLRTVSFGPDGHVRRLPDSPLPVAPVAGTAVTPTPEGDLQLTPPGQQPTVVALD
jgi:hypothetical protein